MRRIIINERKTHNSIGEFMKKVVTYGTYDLPHYGHVRLLMRARSLGDYLTVGLSTDEFNAEKGKKSYFCYE